VLQGSEVKSLRLGNAQMKGAFAKIIDDEVFLFGCHISEYKHANRNNHEPERVRKLLLNRIEIDRIKMELAKTNQTLIASKIFFKKNKAKVLLHLAEGKTHGDKRQTLKKRQQDLDIKRATKDY
jgi:SsrA-binding protein